MSLFTTSQVINDGTSDFTYDSVGQVPSGQKNAVVSQYNRTGYEHLASNLQAKYAYTTSPTQKSVFRTTEMYEDPVTGEKYQMTFNTSVAHDKRIPIATVKALFNRHEAALALAGMRDAFLAKQP